MSEIPAHEQAVNAFVQRVERVVRRAVEEQLAVEFGRGITALAATATSSGKRGFETELYLDGTPVTLAVWLEVRG